MAKKKAAAKKITVEQIRRLVLGYVQQEYGHLDTPVPIAVVERIEFELKSGQIPWVKLWGPKPKGGYSRPHVSFGMESYSYADGY